MSVEQRIDHRVDAKSTETRARATTFTLRRGTVQTPMFMPVGTLGTVKSLSTDELRGQKAQVILGNTYHLFLRPGTETLARFGGLHRFMDWDGPILTDSGGYQFFSLKENTKSSDEGVKFRSHLDGSRHEFTPERVIEIQKAIDSDIMMVLDECPALPATEKTLDTAQRRTTLWADRSLQAMGDHPSALFCIVQGGTNIERRLSHLEALASMQVEGRRFDGLALGGLAVGEAPEEMYEVLRAVAHRMPEDRPRYLMGVGRPEDLLEAIAAGVDMFDCVMPTRNARNGQLFTSVGRLNIRNARFGQDDEPLDPNCACPVCTRSSRSYVHHLFRANEMLGPRLATLHNVSYYLDLMRQARCAIERDEYAAFHRAAVAGWRGEKG